MITSTGTPLNKKFSAASTVGGRTVNTAGIPIYATTTVEQATPGSYTATVPSDLSQVTVTLIGGSGSGAVYTQQGNNGTASTFSIGSSGSIILATGGAGNRGNAATTSTGGAGGTYPGYTITGSSSSSATIIATASSGTGGTGGSGPYWIKDLTDPSVNQLEQILVVEQLLLQDILEAVEKQDLSAMQMSPCLVELIHGLLLHLLEMNLIGHLLLVMVIIN